MSDELADFKEALRCIYPKKADNCTPIHHLSAYTAFVAARHVPLRRLVFESLFLVWLQVLFVSAGNANDWSKWVIAIPFLAWTVDYALRAAQYLEIKFFDANKYITRKFKCKKNASFTPPPTVVRVLDIVIWLYVYLGALLAFLVEMDIVSSIDIYDVSLWMSIGTLAIFAVLSIREHRSFSQRLIKYKYAKSKK